MALVFPSDKNQSQHLGVWCLTPRSCQAGVRVGLRATESVHTDASESMISSCSFYSIICGLLFSYLQGLIILAFAALPQLTPLFHGHLEALHFPSSYCVRSEHKGQGEDTGCAGGPATSLDVACVLVCGTTPQSPWFPLHLPPGSTAGPLAQTFTVLSPWCCL